jgi:phosphoenolpyruvate synthase/pyruvate phosphate dikinase
MKNNKNLIQRKNKTAWITAVARRHTPLFLSLVISGQQNPALIKQQTGMSILFSHIRRKGISLQYDKNELIASRAVIKNTVSKQGLTFFDTYTKHCLNSCQEFLEIAASLGKQSLQKTNRVTLKAKLNRYFDAAVSHAVHLIAIISIQFELEDYLNRYVTERIPDAKQAERILASLKITVEPTDEIANLERLLELGKLVQKTAPTYNDWLGTDTQILKERIEKDFPEIWEIIKCYQNDFGWMGRMYFAGNPITDSDVITRLQNVLRQDCGKNLNKIYTERKRRLTEREQSIIELGGDNETRLLAEIVARYMYLRTYRLSVYFKAHEYVLQPLNKAGEILHLHGGVADIIFLDWREILAGLNGKLTIKEIKHKIVQRRNGFEFLCVDGRTKWLSPNVKSSLRTIHKKHSLTSLKGMTACAGIYKGRVRLILNDEAMQDMFSGEVLVTTMTIPSLMLAVEKAGAIVTDEGGMLCHAAIVSRELNIPCVIGTQKATQVFSDGDLVEVDANNGVVKKCNLL